MSTMIRAAKMTLSDRVYHWQERFLLWLAYRLPRPLVYWAGIRLWCEGADARDHGREPIQARDITCQRALARWEGRD